MKDSSEYDPFLDVGIFDKEKWFPFQVEDAEICRFTAVAIQKHLQTGPCRMICIDVDNTSDGTIVEFDKAFQWENTDDIDQRLDNVAGAFRCTGNALRDKHVILIDDVSTSGATLEACATVMKSAGATTVWGMVTALEL